MAPNKSPRTAPLSAAKCALVLTKLAAIACVLMLMISGTSLLRGSRPGTTDLRGKPFSMVSFRGVAARAAGDAPPYLARMHWFLDSFAWEWLANTTAPRDAANYVFVQPFRPFQMPAVLHDVADSLYGAGHMLDTCQSAHLNASATESCIRASQPFFAAFDAAEPLRLNNGPAFVFYVLALVADVVSPALFSCLAFFSDGGVEQRYPWFRTGVLALPMAFHAIAASILTSNACFLVRHLNQFPDIPADAAIGLRFLIVAWCGVMAELLALALSITRVFLLRLWAAERRRRSEIMRKRRSIPSEPRMQADDV